MKIGIITHYYKSDNYGGNLQAYALCEILKKLGQNPEQICYKRDSKNCNLSFRTKLNISLYNLFDNMCHLKYASRFNRRIRCVSEFNRNVIPHSTKIYTTQTFYQLAENYDLFITGSDIVWAPNVHDSGFFLNLLPNDCNKISYAASLGTDKLTDKQIAFFKKDLNGFRHISVRENTVKYLLEGILEKYVEHSLDPTLLLDREDWDHIADGRLIEESYVFCYFLGINESARKAAEDYAEKSGKIIVNIPYLTRLYSKYNDFGDCRLSDVSPSSFVSLIKYADAIFTDSFHCCVFSSIYNKSFYAFSRTSNDTMSVRITDFLKMTNQDLRYFGNNFLGDMNEYQKLEEKIHVDKDQLEKSRKRSILYLKKACGLS